MQYPNALEGVKKIYKAEIIALIAAIVTVVASIIALAGASTGGLGAALGGGVVMIAAAVLGIIAFILNLIGLNKAKSDEGNFKNALVAVVVGIVGGVLLGATKEGTFLNSVGENLGKICNFLATWFVCTAIYNLSENLHNSDMSARALKARSMLMAVWIIGIAVSVIGSILERNTGSTAVAVIGLVLVLVSAIAEIVAYVLYLKMLKKAGVALEA